MIPIHGLTGQIDRYPARRVQIGGPGIGLGIAFEEHGLLIEAAGPDAHDRLAVAMMIVAELGELLSGDEEGGLSVGEPLFRFGQVQGCLPDAIQCRRHRLTNFLSTLG
mgnify:CR=1 FL=1